MAFYPKQNVIPFIRQKKTHTKLNSKLIFDSIRTMLSWGKWKQENKVYVMLRRSKNLDFHMHLGSCE